MLSVSKKLQYENIPLEQKLFMIQFPRVSLMCISYNISRETIYELWDNIRFIFKDRTEFELALQGILYRLGYIGNLDNLKCGGRFEFYYLKFSGMGVEFKLNDNGIDIIQH